MIHSPADIVRRYLVDQAVGFLPQSTSDPGLEWPIYATSMPDSNGVNDNAICVYNTLGTTDGRDHRSGETFEHPGIQVRVRSNGSTVGHTKAKEIARSFDILKRVIVSIDGASYRIDAISQRGNVISLGVEDDHPKKRDLFTLNAITTIKEL